MKDDDHKHHVTTWPTEWREDDPTYLNTYVFPWDTGAESRKPAPIIEPPPAHNAIALLFIAVALAICAAAVVALLIS